MEPMSKRWSNEERERLKALATGGASIARIAAALRRTEKSVGKCGVGFLPFRERRKKTGQPRSILGNRRAPNDTKAL
jgi:hypothetical protein